jgi:TonB-linked SusC/RagA family outer membrane protein
MILPRSRFLFSRSAVLVLACLWVADGFAQAMAAQVSPVSPVAFGQDGKRITLLRALEDLKARHHISLLFERKNVEGKTVDPAAYETAASADEALTQLLKDTGLQHERIEETVFVVRTQREKKARDGQKNRLKTGAVSPARPDGPRLPGAATPDSAAGPAEARAEVTVSGTVQSDQDEPLPGVSVVVKGTQNGTVTDNEGKYRLTVPDGAAVLVFSFIGYVTEEVPVGNGSTIDVRLLSDVKTLSEVVVVGYGTQERREVTGSIASVKAAELERNINADVTTALQGRAAGVQITQAGGTPGGAVRVRIRGTASILSSGEPLYVIDGIPATLGAFGLPGVARSPLSEINPNDIESVEVLKDASAAAIYGSRAANGVILITTKKGKEGKAALDISYQQGVTDPTNRVAMMNGPQYLEALRKANQNSLIGGLPTSRPNLNGLVPLVGANGYDTTVAAATNTDWLDLVLRRGTYREIALSASGGDAKTLFYVSGGYRREEGIATGNTMDRLSGRVNLDHRLNQVFRVGGNVGLSYVKNEALPLSNTFEDAQSRALPIFPVDAPDNPAVYFNGIDVTTNPLEVRQGANPLFWRDNYSNQLQTFRNTNVLYLEVQPFKGLTSRTEAGLDLQNNLNDVFVSRELYPPFVVGSETGQRKREQPNPAVPNDPANWEIIPGDGRSDNNRVTSTNLSINSTLTYSRTFGEAHKFTGLLGFQSQDQVSNNARLQTEGFQSATLTFQGTRVTRPSGGRERFRFLSYFSRFNYSLRDRYLAEVSVRADATSRYIRNRWGYFPGVSLGWILSEEGFMQDLGFLSFLKVRAGYGLVGNAEGPSNFPYATLLSYTGGNDARYGGYQGAWFQSLGNQDVSWETTRQLSLGLDYGLWNNRVSGSLDFYHKRTEDMLLFYNFPAAMGFIITGVLFNVGSVVNRGVEFSVTSKNIARGPFTWTTDFNIAHNRNEVKKLLNAIPGQQVPPIVDAGTNRLEVGQPIGVYTLPVWAGVDPNTGNELIYEVDQAIRNNTGQTVLTGNVVDGTLLGGNSNFVNNNRVLLTDKTPYPKFFGGLINTFAYKGFDLSALVYFQYGNWIYDQGERAQSYVSAVAQNNYAPQALRAGLVNAWSADGNPSSQIPLHLNSNLAGVETTRFLHDGSFLRLRNVQLGYTLPAALSRRLRVRSLRVYVAGQNLLTYTKYPGWDPEVASNGGLTGQNANIRPGVVGYDLPQVKTLMGGINLGF